MDKKSLNFHVTVRISLLLLLIFSILYFLLLRFSIPLIFYVNKYHRIIQVFGYALLAGYLFTLALLFLRRFKEAKFPLFSLGLFIFVTMLCCLSTNIAIHLPTVLDKAVLDSETYYLTGELESFDIRAYHRLYRCNNRQIRCEMTSFYAGGGASFQPLHLMINNVGKISVIYTSVDGSSRLDYTLRKQSLFYDYPAQLKNRLYYLAYYRNLDPRSVTYTLYECSLDNTSCKQLPFQYIGFGYLREITANEETGEINIIIDNEVDQDTLIFTYGENPRCYVEGCEILEQK